MFKQLKRRFRVRHYFEGFSRACAMVEDLADEAKEGDVEVLIIPRSTVRALYAREKERYLIESEDPDYA